MKYRNFSLQGLCDDIANVVNKGNFFETVRALLLKPRDYDAECLHDAIVVGYLTNKQTNKLFVWYFAPVYTIYWYYVLSISMILHFLVFQEGQESVICEMLCTRSSPELSDLLVSYQAGIDVYSTGWSEKIRPHSRFQSPWIYFLPNQLNVFQ